MRQELQQRLYEKYKYMFDFVFSDPKEPIYLFGIECGDGWYGLLYEGMEKLEKADPRKTIKIIQIKEKFGGLRFYIGYETEEQRKIINEMEYRSNYTCENCGKSGKQKNKNGWINTLCLECWDKLDKGK